MTHPDNTFFFDGFDLHVGNRVHTNVLPRADNGERDILSDGRWWYSRGFIVVYPSWSISIIWGTGTYSSNRDSDFAHMGEEPFTDFPATVEIAVIGKDGRLIEWPNEDTVQGWVTTDECNRLIDYVATWPGRVSFRPNLDWRDRES